MDISNISWFDFCNKISYIRDWCLVSLLDPALEKNYVRSTIAAHMNHLTDEDPFVAIHNDAEL